MSSYLKILFLFLISIALCTTSDNSKNHKSDKHYNKQTKHKADLCLKFDSSAHVTKLCRRFKLINSQSANSNNDQRQQQLALLKSIEDSENSPCDETNKTITLKWSYQFIEEAHCVRVELNFSNVTSFKRKTNFNYYAFSYREITKNNVYLNRHPVNDSVNSLAVLKAHLKPYVICVTFFKNPIQVSTIYLIYLLNWFISCNKLNNYLSRIDKKLKHLLRARSIYSLFNRILYVNCLKIPF